MDADPPLPQPLRRAREGRWLGGVCQGLANRWQIPVVQVRALFLAAVVLAGFGVLAYVACWLVLPAGEEEDDGVWSPGDAAQDALRVLEVIAGVALIALAVLLPLAVVVIGLWLAARWGSRRGRERALDAA